MGQHDKHENILINLVFKKKFFLRARTTIQMQINKQYLIFDIILGTSSESLFLNVEKRAHNTFLKMFQKTCRLFKKEDLQQFSLVQKILQYL